MRYRDYLAKGVPRQVDGLFSSSIKSDGILRIRRIYTNITALAISIAILVVILLVKLLTLFWRHQEAPEINLSDVEAEE